MASRGSEIEIKLEAGKKIYFASDQHFGFPSEEISKDRETKFLAFLNQIKKDAQVLFLVGDLIDFWFEYKKVVPKGFVRILGKLGELSDAGVKIYFFVGNHDLWIRDYFDKELGFETFTTKQDFIINGKKFFIAHGDGLGPWDKGYKRLKLIFTNPVCKWLFRWLHPDIGIALGQYLSKRKKMLGGQETGFLGENREWLIMYSKRKLEEKYRDYFVYGHRHLPLLYDLGEGAQYANAGDWMRFYSYLEFDGKSLELKKFE